MAAPEGRGAAGAGDAARRARIVTRHALPAEPSEGASGGARTAATAAAEAGLGKVLVANRGEIARRVFRAARGLGLATAAVYAEPDARAHHPACADEAFLIPSSPEHQGPIAPYLDGEAILRLCKAHGVSAVHPGYGFLAENAYFAARCGEEGVTFVGPRFEHLELFGDKTTARAFAEQAQVPVLPGSPLCRTLAEAHGFLGQAGERLQWPLLVKAAFGGGGRGQRVVRRREDFDEAFQRCSQEALLGFGDGGCFVEEFLERARHIEVQIVGDGEGRCIHLFERDCSVQLRNQKVVEVAPARGIHPELRARITGAAVRLGEACKYLNAGTVEFLLVGALTDPAARFVFLEMNPRIQVEHTITEQVTWVDLVELQLRVAGASAAARGDLLAAAASAALPAPRGFAIQARVALLPGGEGILAKYAEPSGPGVRVDSGVAQGVMVPAEYDPMILKVIASVPEGQSFEECVRRALGALGGLVLEGLKVNTEALRRILEHELFAGNEVYTRFLGDHPEIVTGRQAPPSAAAAGAGQLVQIAAPFHGQVSEVSVAPGDRVRSSDVLLVISAMKMLNEVNASVAGTVKEVLVIAGQQVAEGALLVVVEASGEQEDAPAGAGGFLQPKRLAAAPAAPAPASQGAGVSSVSSAWFARGAPDALESSAPVITSKVRRDAVFERRQVHNLKLVEELRGHLAWSQKGGGEKYVDLHRSRGKMLPRERVGVVIDPGTSFLELSPLAAVLNYRGEVPAGGIVTGIGLVHGRECVFICNDATVKGGAMFPEGGKKQLRAQEIAAMNHLPCIYLVDGGGAKLDAKEGAKGAALPTSGFVMGGLTFKNQAVMSSKRIPQVACVMGMCTAGAAYIPAMCDESVIIRGNGTVYLGGPPLVKAATGEDADEQELGGGVMHTSRSGVVDHLAETEEEGLLKVRAIMEHLCGRIPRVRLFGMAAPEEPLYDPEELLGIVPEDTKIPFDVKEVIARIVDGSRFHEFKPRYGMTLICGFAHIDGYPVGVLGNNGMLFSESAIKATHFIQICGQRFIPLVFLHNITGFIIGTEYEKGGITKDGAKMIMAVSCVPVPKFCVVLAGSHGAGNYAMNGPAYDPRFTWLWPNAKISVMGGEQAAGVITYVKDKQRRREGLEPLSKEEVDAIKQPIVQAFESSSSAYHSTTSVFDDGVIDPRETRAYLSRGISIALNAPMPEGQFGVFRM